MAISFFTQSIKQVAPIYVRYRELSIDAKARTNIYIDKDRLKGSRVLKYKISARDSQADKLAIQDKNRALDKIQQELNDLEAYIRSQVTANTIINSSWLKQAINPTREDIDNSLLGYYNQLLDSSVNLAKNSINVYRGNHNFMKRYQEYVGKEILVSDVDGRFKESFIKWCVSQGYPMGTIKDNLGRLKAVCNYAESRGVVISNQVKFLTKGIKAQAKESVYLTIEDLNKITALEGLDKDLDTARDWLIVGCYIGQRSASLLKLTKKDIDKVSQSINIQQVKTKAFVTIPILPQVQAILDKYNGDFPPRLGNTDHYNYAVFNRLIKTVCKLAGINEMYTSRVNKHKDSKSKAVKLPKYKLVSSHTLRRSFATNFYGKMNLQSIAMVTGHKSESSFLTYINKSRVVDVDALRNEFLDAMK